MIYAYRNVEQPNTYRLQSEKSRETYHRRQAFKDAGATWDGRHWIVDNGQRQALGIERMMRVSGHDSTCGLEETALVPESHAVVGERISHFCGHCDSWGGMIVEKVEE